MPTNVPWGRIHVLTAHHASIHKALTLVIVQGLAMKDQTVLQVNILLFLVILLRAITRSMGVSLT